jgi:hypothetical protein
MPKATLLSLHCPRRDVLSHQVAEMQDEQEDTVLHPGRSVGSWKDTENHAVLKGRVDLDSVVEVVVQPDVEYPGLVHPHT